MVRVDIVRYSSPYLYELSVARSSDQFQTKRKSEICMETEKKPLDKAKPFQFLAKVVEYFLQPLKFYIKNDFYPIVINI